MITIMNRASARGVRIGRRKNRAAPPQVAAITIRALRAVDETWGWGRLGMVCSTSR